MFCGYKDGLYGIIEVDTRGRHETTSNQPDVGGPLADFRDTFGRKWSYLEFLANRNAHNVPRNTCEATKGSRLRQPQKYTLACRLKIAAFAKIYHPVTY